MKRGKTPGGFAEFVRDQLTDLDDLVTKRMFGGTGLYAGGVFFGLIFRDRLYFHVTEETIGEYKRRKMKPFKSFAGKSVSGRYYEVPVDVLESPIDLVEWARKATKR